MSTLRATAASDQIYGLAEGPVWDAERDRLLWVDINAGDVLSGVLRGDRIEVAARIPCDATVGAVAYAADGRYLVAGTRHLIVNTPGTDTDAVPSTRLIPEHKASRLNDGKCDPAGRFLVGSLALDDRPGDEVLLSVDLDGAVTTLDDDLHLSNGLGWSPDGATFYNIDTLPGLVYSRPYDPATGAVSPRREFVRITDGLPDGMCVDADGNLWIAIWGGGRVRCYSPAGRHLTSIEVPAPNTSSVAFAGPDLGTLVITTASEQLTADQRARFPNSGRLFTCRPGAIGLPATPWAGP